METFAVKLSRDDEGDIVVEFDQPMKKIAFTADQLFAFSAKLGIYAMGVRDEQRAKAAN